MPFAFTILTLLGFLIVLVLALVVSLGIALIGWVLSLLFPLSVFEGAIIGLVASAGIGYVLYQLVAGDIFASTLLDLDEEDESDDWEDEDDEPVAASWRQHRSSSRVSRANEYGRDAARRDAHDRELSRINRRHPLRRDPL